MKIHGVERQDDGGKLDVPIRGGQIRHSSHSYPPPSCSSHGGSQGEHGGYQRKRWPGFVSPSSTSQSSTGCFYDNFFKSGRVACYKDGYPPIEIRISGRKARESAFSWAREWFLGTLTSWEQRSPFPPQRAPNWRTDSQGAETDLSCFPLSQLVIPPWLDLTDPVDHSHHYWV